MLLHIRTGALAILLLALSFTSCNASPRGNVLNPQAYKAAMNDKADEILVDVRTPEEYAEGHINGALNINWNDPAFMDEMAKLDKNKPVFVYCKSGGRSGQAAEALKGMGFKEIYDLEGGIMGWKKAGMKIETQTEGQPQGMNMTDYHNLLNSDKLVLVDFYATWCSPCKKMAPFLEEIAEEQAGKLEIQKINTDKNTQVAQELNISALPTLLLYKSKKVVWSHTGYIGKGELLKKISTFN
jgi:thioredoxin 1